MASSTARSPCDLPSPHSTASFWHKEPSSLLKGHRTTRALPEKADIVIIGSGLTGTSVAHHLLNQDHTTGSNGWKPEVVMLEAREACWGATGRNGGHCQPLLFRRPQDSSVARFELANFHTIQGLIKDKQIDCEFVSQPGVRGIYGLDTLARLEARLHILSESDPSLVQHMQILKDHETIKQYRLTGADAVLITDTAARLWPYKLVSSLLEDLLSNASTQEQFNLQTLTPVISIHRNGSKWTVETIRGFIEAEHVVLATNGYTSHLLPAFSNLIAPCRGQMSALEPPAWLAGEYHLRTSIGFEGAVMDRYLIQRPSESGGQLMLGGGRLLSPSIGISDDTVTDDKVAAYLRTTLVESIDHDKQPGEKELRAEYEWTGIMGWSRDVLPWVGSVPDQQGLYLAAGFTGHGMPNCWLVGKAIGEMLTQVAHGSDETSATSAARKSTGLPTSYLISKERIEKAMKLEFAEALSDILDT